jgi:deazaflavin-dependent oxidoreductase (nitroreductase family)
MSTEFADFNKSIIEEFHANGGKVGGPFANVPLVLLTTIGAKSGQPRIAPLACTTDGDRIIIIASKGGAPTHPDWYHNILANPLVTVEKGTERFQARAVIAEEEERKRLYAKVAALMPNFAEYQQKTTRQIPVVILEHIG